MTTIQVTITTLSFLGRCFVLDPWKTAAMNATLIEMRTQLENWLKNSKATYRVVIGHHPLRRCAFCFFLFFFPHPGWNKIWACIHHPASFLFFSACSFADHGDSPGALLLVDDLLWKYGVHIYINGHDHVLHHVERKVGWRQLKREE